jgi:hypothetical protein
VEAIAGTPRELVSGPFRLRGGRGRNGANSLASQGPARRAGPEIGVCGRMARRDQVGVIVDSTQRPRSGAAVRDVDESREHRG